MIVQPDITIDTSYCFMDGFKSLEIHIIAFQNGMKTLNSSIISWTPFFGVGMFYLVFTQYYLK